MDACGRQAGWTRGQFALWQAGLAVYLLVWLGSQMPTVLAGLSMLSALALLFGWRPRISAVVLWLLLGWIPGAPLAGWLLIIVCLLPSIRTEHWFMPIFVWWLTWLGLAGIYAYSAYCKVLFFWPELIFLHILAFNPRWLRSSQSEYVVFYDGECGLCHRAVRFVLSEDVDARCKLSPLQGDTFAGLGLEQVPDSIALQDGERILWRSSAVVSLLLRIGGYWKVVGLLLWCVPRPIRDFGYMTIARVRHSFFARPPDLCPIMPPELRQRFLL